MIKYLVTDLCGTLILENTTWSFLCNHFSTSLPNKVLIFLARSRIIQFISQRFEKDLSRALLLKVLKGHSIREVEDKAKDYVDEALTSKINNELSKTISMAQTKELTVVIASASLDVIVKQVAKKINAEKYVCSQLEVKNGHYTGNLTFDCTGRKWEKLNNELPDITEGNFIFFTDNREDWELLKKAQKGYYFLYSNNVVSENRENIKKVNLEDYRDTSVLFHTN